MFLYGYFVFLCSCSFLRPTSNSLELAKYFNNNLGNISSDEIRGRLTRIGYMAGGQYEFQVIPITLSMLEAEANELKVQRGLTDYEVQKIISTRKQELIDNKICVEMNLSIVKFSSVTTFSKWNVEIIDSLGGKYPITWKLEDLTKSPISTLFNGLYGIEQKWFNNATGCVRVSLPVEKGFKIKLSPTFVQWPFPDSTILTWRQSI